MSSLYEISAELKTLENFLLELGGDVSEGTEGETIEKWITEYEWQSRQKVDGYCQLIQNMQADNMAIAEEVERLTGRARVLVNRIERLKAMAKKAMELRGVRKLDGAKFTISIQKNGGKDPIELLVEDPARYPDEFVKVVRSPDKEKLRAALETNDPEAVKFARIGQRGESVRIR